MEEKAKEIIAVFIKVPAARIDQDTVIDRAAVKSSILLHRMYARLSEEGISVDNYSEIRTFGDLLRNMAGNAAASPEIKATFQGYSGPAFGLNGGIGIDIEEFSAFPRTNDFRREEFYKMNFTASEIAYCILQPDPYASFAGLFCVKEAIVKADGQLRSRPFHDIGISHTPEGKPAYPGFHLSISHTGNFAAAVAAVVQNDSSGNKVAELSLEPEAPKGKASSPGLIGWLALLCSVLALILHFLR